MCNRYRAASVVRIRDVFGFTYIESGPPLERRAAIGPLQEGPFVRAGGEVVFGQWGLIPDGSDSRIPMRRAGGRMSTNNARWDEVKAMPEKFTFKGPWWRRQRCLVIAEDYDEPCYAVTGKNIWWRFARSDGAPWALAGVWNQWKDPAADQVVDSYTMFTINCNAHPLLRLMHKPDVDDAGQVLPEDRQDKRTVVPIEREHFDQWLHGSSEQAAELMRLPALDLFAHGPADPNVEARLPGW